MKTSAALLIFALSISRASAFKPVVKSSDGNINIDSMDVRVKLRGLEAEFTLSSLFEDIAALKADQAVLLADLSSNEQRLGAIESNLVGGVAQIDSLSGHVTSVAENVTVAVAHNTEQCASVNEDVAAVADGLTKATQAAAAQVQAAKKITTSLQDTVVDTVDVATEIATTIAENSAPRNAAVGPVKAFGNTVLYGDNAVGTIWSKHAQWTSLTPEIRKWVLPSAGRYHLTWTGRSVYMTGGGGFVKARVQHVLDSNTKKNDYQRRRPEDDY